MSIESKIYYSSHNPKYSAFTFYDFIEKEVYELYNYGINDIREWIKKYDVKCDDKVVWVSPLKYVANRYNLPAELWDIANKIPEENMSIYKISGDEGFIIEESDDGDYGFLFIFNNKDD